jgi:carnitine-CoA ligase
MIRHRTLPETLRYAAEQWPDKNWLDFSGHFITFKTADEETNRIAHGLAKLGVKHGDCVCYLLDNHTDLVLLWLALSKIGAVSVPINTAFKGEFLRHQISDAGAKLVVSDAKYVSRIIAIEDGIPETQMVAVRGDTDQRSPRLRMLDFNELRNDDNSPINVDVQPDDLAILLFTSGTTGPSKGCMISQLYLCSYSWQHTEATGVRHDDIYWTPCPLFHIGACGMIVGSLQRGTTVSFYPRFSLSGFWPEIERSGATVILILSSMISLVANAEETEVRKRCYGQIRSVMGLPFPEPLRQIWQKQFGVKNVGTTGYGLTEATPIILRNLEKPIPPGASGRRYESFEVEIVDDHDNILPAGATGEIVVRPTKPGVMFLGYWRRPQATVDTFRNMWFHTGDIGRFDEGGYFYFVDRKKDYLRRGGENISSHEMEIAFGAHPDIEEVAVHAVPAEGAEDEVKVSAILRSGATLTAEALCLWSVERLPDFAVPRYIEFRTDFPRNGVRRVLKYELRKEGVTPATWDRHTSDLIVGKPRRNA